MHATTKYVDAPFFSKKTPKVTSCVGKRKPLSEHHLITTIMAYAFQTILNIVIDLAVVQARQIVAVVQARQIGESKSSAKSGVS